MKSNGSEILAILNNEFASLLVSLGELTESVPAELLYCHPPSVSVGENILKSAGSIEQSFGGLTVNLWDDPFEWTLPEALSSGERIAEYLNEVDQARERAFSSFGSDDALTKLVALPSGEEQPLLKVLLTTLIRAADYRGRAATTLKLLSSRSANRFII